MEKKFYLFIIYAFFFPRPKRLLITHKTRAKINAGIYPSTANPSMSLAVRSTRSPDIRNEISPNVRKFKGAVTVRAIDPMTRFTRENTIATMIAVQYESMVTHGMR